MTIATIPVCDAIRANAHLLPPGQSAGYSTGSGPVPWGDAEWAAHPGAVRICQDQAASDRTADVLDVESGAATIADCAAWCEAAAASFAAAARPGQRHPAVYCSLSGVTPVVDALIAGGIAEGPGLWVANWNLTQAEAVALLAVAGGPFPVIGVQYTNRGTFDMSEFSAAWLAAVSGEPPPAPPAAAQPVVRQGDSGTAVRVMQKRLAVHGASPRPVADGVFGVKTAAAVRAFQGSHFLVQDGICGALTWALLLEAP